MRRATPLLLVTMLATLVTACAPTVPELLAKRELGEALCAVNGYGQGAHHAEVMAALRDQLDPAVHVHGITAEELAPLLGDKAGVVAEAALILKVRYDARPVHLDSFTVQVSLVSASGAAPEQLEVPPESYNATPWLDREQARALIAALTGETIPESEREYYGPSALDNAADAAQAVATTSLVLLEVISLGIVPFVEIFGAEYPAARPSGVHVTHPTDEEVRAQAPATEALIDLFRSDAWQRWTRPGARYEHLQLWQRPPNDAPIELVISAWYDAGSGDLGVECGELELLRVPLPPGATLEERVHAVFGDRMRRLYDLVDPVSQPPPQL